MGVPHGHEIDLHKRRRYEETISQIIEALRGDAAQVAMDIGTAELMKVGMGDQEDP